MYGCRAGLTCSAKRSQTSKCEQPWAQGLPTITTPLAVTDAAHGHCCSVNAIARCTGYVCSGGGDAAIRVWKSRSLEPVR